MKKVLLAMFMIAGMAYGEEIVRNSVSVNTYNTTAVTIAGNQTITGTKTFSTPTYIGTGKGVSTMTVNSDGLSQIQTYQVNTTSLSVAGNTEMNRTQVGLFTLSPYSSPAPQASMKYESNIWKFFAGTSGYQFYNAVGSGRPAINWNTTQLIFDPSAGTGVAFSTWTANGLELHGDLALTGGATVQGLINIIGTLLTNGQAPTVGQSLKMFTSSISWGN